jgi:hypothetical protein
MMMMGVGISGDGGHSRYRPLASAVIKSAAMHHLPVKVNASGHLRPA